MIDDVLMQYLDTLKEQQSDLGRKLESLIDRIDCLDKAFTRADILHVTRDEYERDKRAVSERIADTTKLYHHEFQKAIADLEKRMKEWIGGIIVPITEKYSTLDDRQRDLAATQKALDDRQGEMQAQVASMQATISRLVEAQDKLSKIVLGNGQPSLPELVRRSNETAEKGLKASQENAERLNELLEDRKKRFWLLKDINTYGKAVMDNSHWVVGLIGGIGTFFNWAFQYLNGTSERYMVLTALAWVSVTSIVLFVVFRVQKAVQDGKSGDGNTNTA